jgi:hypothetical protein
MKNYTIKQRKQLKYVLLSFKKMDGKDSIDILLNLQKMVVKLK